MIQVEYTQHVILSHTHLKVYIELYNMDITAQHQTYTLVYWWGIIDFC